MVVIHNLSNDFAKHSSVEEKPKDSIFEKLKLIFAIARLKFLHV